MDVDAQTMAEVESIERSCPLCGDADFTVVGIRDRRGAPLRTVLCAGCGHVFTNPAPTQDALAAYYRDSYRQDYKRITAPKRKHIYRAGIGAMRRLARLAPYVSKGAKIIDVGAGGGEFVYLLSTRGFDAHGIEPHAGYAGYARSAYSIDIQSGTLETAAFPPDQADAITLHHVLEHTANPMAALQKIWSWLKPDGIVVVEVPNLSSWAHAPHHRFHRAHLHTFSRTSIEDSLMNAGFRVENINPPGDKNHLNAVARKVSQPEKQSWRNVATGNETVLETHTRLAHFCSGQPLRRIHANLTRPIREAAAIRALGNPDTGRELLDKLFAE